LPFVLLVVGFSYAGTHRRTEKSAGNWWRETEAPFWKASKGVAD